jgi:hypothetical protein
MTCPPSLSHPYSRYGFVLLCLVIAGALFVVFFEHLPIEGTSLAIDWQGLWGAIAGGEIRYESSRGFRIPPWDALLILPLGFLSMRASWGLIAFITLLVLVVSVPRSRPRWLYWLAILLLVTSFPALRHSADGNFEALVIGGILLIVHGYTRQQPYLLAGGILLAVAKPQEVVLLVVVLAIYVLQTFPRQKLFRVAGALAVIVIPLMIWRGGEWLTAMLTIAQRGSIMDVSLAASLSRTEMFSPIVVNGLWLLFLGATLVISWKSDRTFSRDKAAMLVAASLLISPYAAGNSVLTVLAVGIIPLFLQRPLLAGLLILLFDNLYFWNADMLYHGSYYWTAILLLCWGLFAWRCLKSGSSSQVDAIQTGATEDAKVAFE